ncbi:hypothetical protein FRZ67_06695 [Panacibacter ginsenosidivorans]|uniref:Uncharacterized protein n=1 Tax=Panacibacter ginsenosidivorans TaxID=1813871 RepID=A0A5B8V9G4_9BACT|nr:hypothetical protein [Panacibacter ginsenosidivorans]QEC66998.1 hypothetical protein FRZ67_06695 [Panacibacter ginsenosidivorans]
MVPANVKLSKNELSLVCDEAFILTKNNIIDKVYKLFGQLSMEFTNKLQQNNSIPEPEIFLQAPKIYKGEQYKSLPYVMLDQPRCFNSNDAFAIRCFFWWGNFFSITLHLGGKYASLYSHSVIRTIDENNMHDWYYCINENQWQHDFGEHNYTIITKDNIKTITAIKKDFFKISRKIPLIQWDNAYDFYLNNFSAILSMLNTQ